jgi:hypothetical protein
MQSPTASDPSFKAFLEKLQEQNNRGFATQLVQLKAEREIAGEDGDKREEQLNDVISSLKEVRAAVTGNKLDVDLTPLVNIGENQTKLLEELSKESSLTRKLTEGSVEYDKEAAQYRNTSGRDIESKVSGKTSKDGGFIDFETARDTLSGQGKRVRDENAFSLKPINYSPGKAVAAAVGAKNKKEDKEDVDNFDPSLLGRLKSFMTDGESDRPGYGLFQKPPIEVEKKEREAKVSSPRQENPEADNIHTTGEIEADAAKSDLELSKQMLDTTREQLTVLKEIRDALAPKTPRELTEQKGAPSSTTEKEKDGGGSLLGDLASGAPDLMGSKGKLGKMGGRLMTAGKAALPYAAAAGVAIAGGAAVDYGLGKLGVGKDKEGNDLQVDTAQDDANWAKMSTGQKIQSGLARGIEKTGSALFLGNVSKEAQSERIKKETDYLNKNAPGAATKEALAAPLPTEGESRGAYAVRVSKLDAHKKRAKEEKYDSESVEALQEQRIRVAERGPATDSLQSKKAHERVLGSLDKAIEDKKSKPTEGKLSEVKSVTPVDGRSAMVKQREEGRRTTFGSLYEDTPSLMKKADKLGDQATKLGIDPNNATGTYEGGVLTKITDKVSGKDHPIEVPEESRAKVEAARNLRGTGSEVAKTSTDNADMAREASGRGGANNTVVSNNVSSINTTKFVPMKLSPRAENTGSALDRYTSRITTF